jgi:hypothetical protein
MRRLFRFALGTSIANAVTQRSKRWLTVAGGLVLFRLIERITSRHSHRRAKD